MKTVFSVLCLVVFAVIGSRVLLFVGNMAGLPGALLAGRPGKRSARRFWAGVFISALGQSYVFLAFVAFVVNWTALAAVRDDVIALVVWPVAFVATSGALWGILIAARVEAADLTVANPQVSALDFTWLVSMLGLFVFAFAPGVLRWGWGWIPYVD